MALDLIAEPSSHFDYSYYDNIYQLQPVYLLSEISTITVFVNTLKTE